MRSIPTIIALAGIAALGFPAPAPAQTLPDIATFTVPVKLSNIDSEPLPKMSVVCSLLDQGGFTLAIGDAVVPATPTQATLTTRSMYSFDGNVTVTLTAAKELRGFKGGGASTGGVENAEQAAGRETIKRAAKYTCTLGRADRLDRATQFGGPEMKKPSVGEVMIGGKPVKALTEVLLVSGPVPK